MPNLLFLCTGNATRSVLAGAFVRAERPSWTVRTAGTLVIEGLPMSWRTRTAMASVGLAHPDHRSVQLRAKHLADTDLVVALAGEHVDYVRKRHPEAAARTATLRRVVRDLKPGTEPLRSRVAALRFAEVCPEPWEDVEDPGGQETEKFLACASDIQRLMGRFLAALT